MDVAAADFRVVRTRRPSSHQAIAEVDEAAEGDEAQQQRLLESHRVRGGGFLLEQRSRADVGVGAKGCAAQENRALHKPAGDGCCFVEYRVDDRGGALGSHLRPLSKPRLSSLKSRARVQHRACVNTRQLDVGRDVGLAGIDDSDTGGGQLFEALVDWIRVHAARLSQARGTGSGYDASTEWTW